MQVGNTLLLSKEFQSLSAGAQMLYLCAYMESGGRRQFTLPARALKKYGTAFQSGADGGTLWSLSRKVFLLALVPAESRELTVSMNFHSVGNYCNLAVSEWHSVRVNFMPI